MNHDLISKTIGLVRYANALRKISGELTTDIYHLELGLKKMLKRRWLYIMIHHSLTKDSGTVSWQAIRRYHMQTLGWVREGYHFGLELVNNEYEILVGRPLDMDGAHCNKQGMNSKALGICFVGNFDIDPVPEGQWEKGIEIVKSLVNLLDIPTPFIVGHRDFDDRTCPGRLFDLNRFRAEVAS